MNRFIQYIEQTKLEVNDETYKVLLNDFNLKLSMWLMEKPRFSDDQEFIDMTTAISFIKKELNDK